MKQSDNKSEMEQLKELMGWNNSSNPLYKLELLGRWVNIHDEINKMHIRTINGKFKRSA